MFLVCLMLVVVGVCSVIPRTETPRKGPLPSDTITLGGFAQGRQYDPTKLPSFELKGQRGHAYVVVLDPSVGMDAARRVGLHVCRDEDLVCVVGYWAKRDDAPFTMPATTPHEEQTQYAAFSINKAYVSGNFSCHPWGAKDERC